MNVDLGLWAGNCPCHSASTSWEQDTKKISPVFGTDYIYDDVNSLGSEDDPIPNWVGTADGA
jgi:hypothetical protein